MVKRFRRQEGIFLETIYGQSRLAYSLSGNEDFYDMIAWAKRGGYQGSVIRFYDFESEEVVTPFEKQRNVLYGKVTYADGAYYFLKGDFNTWEITLYRYIPEGRPEAVQVFDARTLELYNLAIMGNGVYIISQNDLFRCYYPDTFSFGLTPTQSVCFIEDGKVYLEEWVEEGWDKLNDCATDDYRFYHKVIVKDFKGNTISEEIGFLHQANDGVWWIA